MDSGTSYSRNFGDSRRLQKIDKLTAIGLGDYISLPQLVVVGDQSSGKSSVLEALTELPFPRESSLCTRFATQIVFHRAETETISISIIPSASSDTARVERLKAFKINNLRNLTAENFVDLINQACRIMGLPTAGSTRQAEQTAFAEDIFRIELRGPRHSHLSVIDVPGIFRIPIEGVTTKADVPLVRGMVRRFIENRRTIILAVLPANVDIATQEILDIAEEVDKPGERTLGVITKPDLIDKGAEKDLLEIVAGRKRPLKLGYCVLRNRSQEEKDISPAERNQKETEFFKAAPFSHLPKDRVGVVLLLSLLRSLLGNLTRRSRWEIDKLLYLQGR